MSNDGVTILVRTKNSEIGLKNLIPRLGLTEYDQLLCVDSGSSDETYQLCLEFNGRFVEAPQPFHYSTSLNYGVSNATCPWIWVLSSHCIPKFLNSLSILKKELSQVSEEVGVVYTPVIPTDRDMPSEPLSGSWFDTFAVGKEMGGNGSAVYRSDLVRRYPFNTNVATSEDLIWFKRVSPLGVEGKLVLGVPVYYQNRGTTRWMFYKGYLEALHSIRITGGTLFTLWSVPVGFYARVRRIIQGDTSLRDGWSQMSQFAGVCVLMGIYWLSGCVYRTGLAKFLPLPKWFRKLGIKR